MIKTLFCALGILMAHTVSAQPAQDRKPTDAEKVKPPAIEQKQYQGRKGGRTNRNPTDTRIKEEGIKLPSCAVESRESVECPK